MRRTLALTLAVSLPVAVAGCGGGQAASTTTPTQAPPQANGCAFVKASDIQPISGVAVHPIDLAVGAGTTCSTAFADSSGTLIATVSELAGGATALRTLRSSKAEELGSSTLHDLPALGPGAFLVRKRYLALRRGKRVFVVETGYARSGALALDPSQLLRLARLVVARS